MTVAGVQSEDFENVTHKSLNNSDISSDDDSYENIILRPRGSDSSSDVSSEEKNSLSEELAHWAVITKATASSCDMLLRILHKCHPFWLGSKMHLMC